MKTQIPLLLVALLGGCVEQSYREGVESLAWPSVGEPRYSVSIGSDSQISLENHRTGQKSTLPFFTRKLSAPITNRIRFSPDGKFLMIPVRKDDLLGGDPSYFLEIWDIEENKLWKEVSIHKKFLDESVQPVVPGDGYRRP